MASSSRQGGGGGGSHEQSRISVGVRIRPLSTKEEEGRHERKWGRCESDSASLVEQDGLEPKQWAFDRVFGEDESTGEVYDRTVANLIPSVLDGIHGTALVYGQTSSGKTYTMFGNNKTQGTVQMGLEDLFKRVASCEDRTFNIEMSYIEVYNEMIWDLLEEEPDATSRIVGQAQSARRPPRRESGVGLRRESGSFSRHNSFAAAAATSSSGAGGGRRRESAGCVTPTKQPLRTPKRRPSSVHRSKAVSVRDNQKGGVTLSATRRVVNSLEGALRVLRTGEANRHVSSTGMNERSSRAHTILTVHVESASKSPPKTLRQAQLNFVDLAGSESMRTSQASGAQIAEAKSINQSLLALALVISSLAEAGSKGGRGKHVSFRTSKLTRILKPALSGESLVSIVCCITPSSHFMEETRSTLQFARTAGKVRINAKVNEVVTAENTIQQLRQELEALKRLKSPKAEGSNFRHGRKVFDTTAVVPFDCSFVAEAGATTPCAATDPQFERNLVSRLRTETVAQREKIGRLKTILKRQVELKTPTKRRDSSHVHASLTPPPPSASSPLETPRSEAARIPAEPFSAATRRGRAKADAKAVAEQDLFGRMLLRKLRNTKAELTEERNTIKAQQRQLTQAKSREVELKEQLKEAQEELASSKAEVARQAEIIATITTSVIPQMMDRLEKPGMVTEGTMTDAITQAECVDVGCDPILWPSHAVEVGCQTEVEPERVVADAGTGCGPDLWPLYADASTQGGDLVEVCDVGTSTHVEVCEVGTATELEGHSYVETQLQVKSPFDDAQNEGVDGGNDADESMLTALSSLTKDESMFTCTESPLSTATGRSFMSALTPLSATPSMFLSRTPMRGRKSVGSAASVGGGKENRMLSGNVFSPAGRLMTGVSQSVRKPLAGFKPRLPRSQPRKVGAVAMMRSPATKPLFRTPLSASRLCAPPTPEMHHDEQQRVEARDLEDLEKELGLSPIASTILKTPLLR